MAFFNFDADELKAMLEEPEVDIAELQGCKEVVKRYESLSCTWYE